MKNRQFNKRYMNIMFRFNRYLAELMPFLNRNVKNSNDGKFQMSNGHKYHYVGSILAVFSLQFVVNHSYAAMPTSNVYEANQLGSVVWTDYLYFSKEVSGSAAGSRSRTIRYNSIVYPGATWGMSSDGAAYGFILAPDIILVIDGIARVNAHMAIGQNNTRGGWSVNYSGKALPTVTGSGALPLVFTATPGQGDHYWGVGPQNDVLNGWLSVTPYFNGNTSVYLGPKAKAGVLTIPNTIAMEIVDGSKLNIIEAGTTIEIKVEMACTVLAPPTIDFGVIHGLGVKENAYIAQQAGNLTVNCTSSSQDATANVKVQVLGDALSNLGYILPLKNDRGELAPGEIRGWINKAPTNTCSDSGNTTNGLYFGDSGKWYEGGSLRLVLTLFRMFSTYVEAVRIK